MPPSAIISPKGIARFGGVSRIGLLSGRLCLAEKKQPKKRFPENLSRFPDNLSGPLNRLNAILSLLHPLDRYRTPSAIGSAIGRALSRPISPPNTGGNPQPPHSKPLGGLNRAIVAL